VNVDKELRAIVIRGEQMMVEMGKEQKIVDSYDYSKGWFMETFDRLKKSTDKSLHKIDFTNFIQLSTVLKDEQECVTLLKNL
jgi:hypothetical protein